MSYRVIEAAVKAAFIAGQNYVPAHNKTLVIERQAEESMYANESGESFTLSGGILSSYEVQDFEDGIPARTRESRYSIDRNSIPAGLTAVLDNKGGYELSDENRYQAVLSNNSRMKIRAVESPEGPVVKFVLRNMG